MPEYEYSRIVSSTYIDGLRAAIERDLSNQGRILIEVHPAPRKRKGNPSMHLRVLGKPDKKIEAIVNRYYFELAAESS